MKVHRRWLVLLGFLGIVGWCGCDAFRFVGRSGSSALEELDSWAEEAGEAPVLEAQPAVRSVLTSPEGHVVVVFFHRELVDDSTLATLAGLEHLKVLDLVETRITDAGLKHLAGLQGLEILYLKMTEVGDAGMASLAGLPRLHTLYLSRTQVGDEGLKHLGKLVNLEMLILDGTRITNQGLAALANLSKLQVLDLSGTAITDEGLQHLEPLRNLRHLYLLNTQVTEQGVRQLREKLPKTLISYSRSRPVGPTDRHRKASSPLSGPYGRRYRPTFWFGKPIKESYCEFSAFLLLEGLAFSLYNRDYKMQWAS